MLFMQDVLDSHWFSRLAFVSAKLHVVLFTVVFHSVTLIVEKRHV
jgi:hypothetical protein